MSLELERTVPRLGVVFDELDVVPMSGPQGPIVVLQLKTKDLSVGATFALNQEGGEWLEGRLAEALAAVRAANDPVSQNGNTPHLHLPGEG